MKQIKYMVLVLALASAYSCQECEELAPTSIANRMDGPYCGWTVSTFYGGKFNGDNKDEIVTDPAARVGEIYNTQIFNSANIGDDWGATIEKVSPANWTVDAVGQVYGIAIDNNNSIFLASSNLYVENQWGAAQIIQGNPTNCGMIYKCEPPSFDPIPFVSLDNSCGFANGIGNIAFDAVNNQLYASNLEDGKIYSIGQDGNIVDSYDPFMSDDGVQGRVALDERIYGLAVRNENSEVRIYFTSTSGELYYVPIIAGEFPPQGSEVMEISGLEGGDGIVSDIAFSVDGNLMTYSKYGNINSSKVYSYTRNSTSWVSNGDPYFVGGNIDLPGGNSAGGVDFGPLNDGAIVSATCDEFIYSTGKNLIGNSIVGEMEGIQIYSATGNSQFSTSPSSNSVTDRFIDYDQIYVDPCDVDNSFIMNAGFEDLVDVNNPPTNIGQLDRAKDWVQATAATSDFYYLPGFGGIPNLDLPVPPNGSNGFVATYSILSTNYFEYVGGCLSNQLENGIEYTFSLLVGAANSLTYSSPEIDLDIVLLGLPSCSLPIAGTDCKESNFTILDRIPLNLAQNTWEMKSSTFVSPSDFEGIMFGLSCSSSTAKYDQYYAIFDDIIITQGDGCDGATKLVNYPGDVELFKCEGCLGPANLSNFLK